MTQVRKIERLRKPRNESVSQVLTVTLPIPPSTNTLYATGNDRRVLSKAGRDYHHDAGWLVRDAAMKQAWRTRPMQRYSIDLVLHFANRRPRDLDNCAKVLIDAAAAVLGFNDSRVDMLTIRRGDVDKTAPHVDVTIGVLA